GQAQRGALLVMTNSYVQAMTRRSEKPTLRTANTGRHGKLLLPLSCLWKRKPATLRAACALGLIFLGGAHFWNGCCTETAKSPWGPATKDPIRPRWLSDLRPGNRALP